MSPSLTDLLISESGFTPLQRQGEEDSPYFEWARGPKDLPTTGQVIVELLAFDCRTNEWFGQATVSQAKERLAVDHFGPYLSVESVVTSMQLHRQGLGLES